MIMEFIVGFIFGSLIVVIFSPSKRKTEEKEDRELRKWISEYLFKSPFTADRRWLDNQKEEIFNYIKNGTRKDKTDSTVD